MKKNKVNNHIYSIHGINNSCELLNSKEVEIISIFILDKGKAFYDSVIKKNIESFKDKCTFFDKNRFDKKFPFIRSQGIVINFKFELNNYLPKSRSETS